MIGVPSSFLIQGRIGPQQTNRFCSRLIIGGLFLWTASPGTQLKNLFWTRVCFFSTRVAKFDPSRSSRLEGLPIAYLVSPTETNNDATNYWIFSRTGLLRLFERTGWEVCCYKHFGNLEDSDPASDVGDERAFCLLKSTKV